MVVLDGHNMLTGPNQYLQPDYLSPLPTTVSYLEENFQSPTTNVSVCVICLSVKEGNLGSF